MPNKTAECDQTHRKPRWGGAFALNAYLLRRLIDSTQTGSGLTAEEAERIAYKEPHASRREQHGAA